MQKGYLASGVLWGFLLFSATAQAAIIGSQTASSTPLAGSATMASYDFGFDATGITGTLKAIDLYISVSGTLLGNPGKSGTDVEGTYTAIRLNINCATTPAGQNNAGFFIADYPNIVRDN